MKRTLLSPDALTVALRRKALLHAERWGDALPSKELSGYIVGLLEQAIGGKQGQARTQKRHLITERVWGIISSKDWRTCHVQALIDYLKQPEGADLVGPELAALLDQIQTEKHGEKLL